MRCHICDTYCGLDDNYCRQCGASLRIQRLPARRSAALPMSWRGPAGTMTKGVAVLAAGALGQWAARQACRQAASLLKQALLPSSSRRRLLPDKRARRGERIPEGGYAISETLVMRKVTLQR